MRCELIHIVPFDASTDNVEKIQNMWNNLMCSERETCRMAAVSLLISRNLQSIACGWHCKRRMLHMREPRVMIPHMIEKGSKTEYASTWKIMNCYHWKIIFSLRES